MKRSSAIRRHIAVCDHEILYACHLIEYLVQHEHVLTELRAYSSLDSLLEDGRSAETALLIISEAEYRAEEVDGRFEKVLILEETGQMDREKHAGISKYCPMELVVGRIRELCPEIEEAGSLFRSALQTRVIGAYTPISRCLQTTFCLALGQLLGRSERTLYLNLEPCSGIGEITGTSACDDLRELIYYADCAGGKAAGKIASMTKKIGTLELLPVVSSPAELQSVSAEQWLGLMDVIVKETEYEELIIDFSDSAEGLFRLLEQCDLIFTIRRTDAISRAKQKQYDEAVMRMETEDIFRRSVPLTLPEFTDLPENPEKLTNCSLAEYLQSEILPILADI